MKNLSELIAACDSVSFIGMCKNAGKTTVFNRVVRELREQEIPVAVTSVGRDGESTDVVTNTAKPGIYVYEGTVIATAAGLLKYCDITKEILRTTGIFTPMGEIVILRAVSDGFVQLAGPSITTQLAVLSGDFRKFGAEKILIDGALGRKSLCVKKVSQSTILCTGASYDRDMRKVVRDTAYTCELLDLPQVEYAVEDSVWEQNACKYIPVWNSREIAAPSDETMPLKHAGNPKLKSAENFIPAGETAPLKRAWNPRLKSAERFIPSDDAVPLKRAWNPKLKSAENFIPADEATPERLWRRGTDNAPLDILVQGGLTDAMVKGLLMSNADLRGRRMILRDGSRILLSYPVYEKLKIRGLTFAVSDAIRLLAVTVNPFSAYGFHFDPGVFLERMAEAVREPVFNVMAG